MDTKKNKLGMGLSALLGDSNILEEVNINKSPQKQNIKNSNREIIKIPVENISVNPFQPRHFFSDEAINELSESIKAKGLLQPILVRSKGENKFEIISGERRFRAIKKLDYKYIPAIVKNVKDSDMLEIGLAENLQREDLNPVEEAKGYKLLIDKFNYTQEQLSTIVHKSRPYIGNILRLLKLPNEVLQAIEQGKISTSHARTLIREANPEEKLKQILNNKLSVRDAEKIQQNKQKKNIKKSEKSAEIFSIEQSLTDILQSMSEVKINTDNSGEIKIKFKDLEDLDRILNIINSSNKPNFKIKIPKFNR